jgi:hypothetical protein
VPFLVVCGSKWYSCVREMDETGRLWIDFSPYGKKCMIRFVLAQIGNLKFKEKK